MTARALRWIAWTLTGVYWIALFIVTHTPPQNLPHVQASDKLLHFLVYFLLAIGVYVSLWLTGFTRFWSGFLVLTGLWIYGAIDELLQIPVGRIADVHDWYADAAGVVAAVIVLAIVRLVLEKLHRVTARPASRE